MGEDGLLAAADAGGGKESVDAGAVELPQPTVVFAAAEGDAEVDPAGGLGDAEEVAEGRCRLLQRVDGPQRVGAIDGVVHTDVLQGREADDLVEAVVAQGQVAHIGEEVGDAQLGEGAGLRRQSHDRHLVGSAQGAFEDVAVVQHRARVEHPAAQAATEDPGVLDDPLVETETEAVGKRVAGRE